MYFPSDAPSLAYAQQLDKEDTLAHLRKEFVIPSIADLKRKAFAQDENGQDSYSEESTYLCGNSLGLQPRRTQNYIQAYLRTWQTKGVYGHFKEIEDSPIPPWLHLDEAATSPISKIVGAKRSEVAVMETLTVNLHLLMASFYRPDKERYKIIIEGKAFPSDHLEVPPATGEWPCVLLLDQYAVESQIIHHGFDPKTAMIQITSPNPDQSPLIPTPHILSVIDEHADSTALILLPGVQFYTGQFLDIATITKYAHERNILIGWDLAHAVGNVPLRLREWNVDFAAWCSYKYLNCGPGSIGGLFVHEKHGEVTDEGVKKGEGRMTYLNRLSGWWGSSKASRFAMENRFTPIEGAGGWQLSNPSALDLTSVIASMSVYEMTDMDALRAKSLRLTAYLEYLLTHHNDRSRQQGGSQDGDRDYEIITSSNPAERGAQLSVRLRPGLLDGVMEILEEEGVVVDERKPDVIRIAPAPLYNNAQDVWRFVDVFRTALERVIEKGGAKANGSVMVEGGREDKGWSEIK